ncbi:MAG TPA: sugar ABC transporter permease [Chloroflexia bacterium]|nr:sugar ABC transporter permease [Chloroflexia bacterium]
MQRSRVIGKEAKAQVRIKNKVNARGNPYPFYFVFGALILYLVFSIIPAFIGFLYSFTDWNSFSTDIKFVGLDNFATVFSSDENYVGFIKNTLVFTIVTIVLKTVLGLLFALLLTEGVKRLANFHRLIIYLPVVLPTLVVGLVFKSILNPQTGVLNQFLRGVGLNGLAQKWLVDAHIALFSIIGVDTWKGVGYIMVILLAGLQAIPREYYEAAAIDGATFWQRLRHVTIPLLMPVITVTTVLNLLYGLKVFDIVYALTNGGPGYATDVVYTAVFKDFGQGRYGVASALSTVLFIIMIVFGYFVIKFMTRKEQAE